MKLYEEIEQLALVQPETLDDLESLIEIIEEHFDSLDDRRRARLIVELKNLAQLDSVSREEVFASVGWVWVPEDAKDEPAFLTDLAVALATGLSGEVAD